MIVRPLSRRALLCGGGAALSLPWLDAMSGLTAHAQNAAAPPKRVLFYFTANGFPPVHWRCTVNQEVTPTAGLKLSHILEPLEPVKELCTFIEGVPMNSGLDQRTVAIAHAAGTAAVFTGSYAPPGTMYGGAGAGAGFPPRESVDQLIAKVAGKDTRFPAYHLGVMVADPTLLKSVFYAGKDQPITPNSDAYAVRDEVFGAAFADSLANNQAAAQLRRADQTVVLDAVLESAQSLKCRLGAEDRARLDLHLTQVREIEGSLDALVATNPACAEPGVAPGLALNQASGFPIVGRVQSDLMAMALTCDLTRVGGFFYSPALNNPTYTWLGHTDGHHNMTHDTALYDQCADVNRWHAGELLYLVNKLANTPEGNGSVLDNTVIMWASECAQTYKGDPHDLSNVGFTLIGGGQGHFKTGQYLKFPGGDAYSHNRLLLSLAQYMGVQTEAVGEPEYNAGGPLPHLTL